MSEDSAGFRRFASEVHAGKAFPEAVSIDYPESGGVRITVGLGPYAASRDVSEPDLILFNAQSIDRLLHELLLEYRNPYRRMVDA